MIGRIILKSEFKMKFLVKMLVTVVPGICTVLKFRQNELQEIAILENIFIEKRQITLTVILYIVQLQFCMEYIMIDIFCINFKCFYG